jgi:putative transposase
MFQFFDPNRELQITRRNLPHWYQECGTYFVTFRTSDSVPKALSTEWHRNKSFWLRSHGIDPIAVGLERRLNELLSPQLLQQYHNTFTQQFHDYLDKGHGACLLAKEDFAQIVADSFHHFNGERYHLGDFVIMPNHVHVLVCLIGGTDLKKQCYSWKRFTATRINTRLDRKGDFWQPESFDHIVRSEQQLFRFRDYIRENPKNARLRPGSYLYYSSSWLSDSDAERGPL